MNNMDIRKQFGQVIKKYRTEQNLSQEKLSELTGMHRTYISEVERGERNISIINIDKFSQALNIKISELFSRME